MSDGVAVGAVGAGFAVAAGGLTGWFGLEPWPVPAVPGPPVEGAASERAAEPELAPEPELAAPEPAALELAAPEPAPLAPTAEPLDAAGPGAGGAGAPRAGAGPAGAARRAIGRGRRRVGLRPRRAGRQHESERNVPHGARRPARSVPAPQRVLSAIYARALGVSRCGRQLA